MRRIEEIRQKHEESLKDGEFRIFAADIEYLLSRLQTTEEALDEAKKEYRREFSKLTEALLAINSFNLACPEPEACVFETEEEKEDYIDAIRQARELL